MAILRKLRRFSYRPPLQHNFLEMAPLNFAYCESDSPPHPPNPIALKLQINFLATNSAIVHYILYLKSCS